MIVIIYFCISVTLMVLIWHTSLHYSKSGRIVNKIPGLPLIPIFANMLSLAILLDESWPTLRYLFNKYDSLFRVWTISYPAVFMCHPDDVQSCKKNINKSDIPYSYLKKNLARAEILKILGNEKDVTTKNIRKMEYLERCVKEVLRLFPTASHIGRTITNEIRLRKHTLPPGTQTCISVYDLHRNNDFWPEPNEFDPDRFLPENFKQRHPFTYLPFSAGPRACIVNSQKFAESEIKLTVAHILYNFYLEPADVIADLKLETHFTIKTSEIKMKFVKINRN